MAKEVDAMFEFDSSTEAVDSQLPGSFAATPHGDNVNRQPIQLVGDMASSQFSECPQSATNETIFSLGTSTIEHDNEADCHLQDFCENKFLAEAMLEYEQAVRIPTNAYSSNISASTSNQNDPFLGISFPSQEQGWIWGWNFPESK
ncbi:hypothetical protein FVEN_g6878 [Fusarium venenatum]|nr:hypothetical protein FVEN_g6878 [Fusarium venenatum]